MQVIRKTKHRMLTAPSKCLNYDVVFCLIKRIYDTEQPFYSCPIMEVIMQYKTEAVLTVISECVPIVGCPQGKNERMNEILFEFTTGGPG